MEPQNNIYKLEEGAIYSFNIIRIIEMPPDGEEYYVLESEFNTRFILLKKFYDHYHYVIGQTILCKVDKVNCNGKIFLEPEHPGCKPGEILDFTNSGYQEIKNSFGEDEILLVLHDPWNRVSHLNILNHTDLITKNNLSCKIERIKKGFLLISYPGIKYFGNAEVALPGDDFIITGICTLAENLEYYTLDQNGSIHYLRTKYYLKYGFNTGDHLNCRVLANPALYDHYLEPVHPFYQLGQDYWFDFVKLIHPENATEKPFYYLMVRDLLGHEYKLEYHSEEPHWVNKVKAKVIDIRMSKCKLDLIEIE
jgi:hypothetical protein